MRYFLVERNPDVPMELKSVLVGRTFDDVMAYKAKLLGEGVDVSNMFPCLDMHSVKFERDEGPGASPVAVDLLDLVQTDPVFHAVFEFGKQMQSFLAKVPPPPADWSGG